jgi:hypothetical protein
MIFVENISLVKRNCRGQSENACVQVREGGGPATLAIATACTLFKVSEHSLHLHLTSAGRLEKEVIINLVRFIT